METDDLEGVIEGEVNRHENPYFYYENFVIIVHS